MGTRPLNSANLIQRLAEQRIRITFGVDIRGIDEVNPGIERRPDLRFDLGKPELANGFPSSLATICHGAKADFRYKQAATVQYTILHFPIPPDCFVRSPRIHTNAAAGPAGRAASGRRSQDNALRCAAHHCIGCVNFARVGCSFSRYSLLRQASL